VNKTTGDKVFYNKVNSGLPDNSVLAIAVDNSGKKWICTLQGLAEFDGTAWTVYNPSSRRWQ
jgi:ligand-binding sensor domain-containing protein